MRLHSPSLARREIATGGIVRSSASTPQKQHLSYFYNSLHSANFIPASQAATVTTLKGSTWDQTHKLKNVAGLFLESVPGTVSVVKLSCISQQVQKQERRRSLCSYRPQSENVSRFVNYPSYYGDAKRCQFFGSSYSTTVHSSTRVGIQQPLAASSLPRSLEDEVSEGRGKEQDNSLSEAGGEYGSLADLDRISSLQISSEEAGEAVDVQRRPADDDVVANMKEVQKLPPQKRKKKALDVRKPQEVEKGDFATRFVPSAQLPASNGQAPQEPDEASDVEYYVPRAGDEVIGVIVSGNEYKLDVDLGSQQLGRVLTKDIYPLDLFPSDELFWGFPAGEGEQMQDFPVGRVRVVYDEEVFSLPAARSPLVEIGSVLRFKVLGVTLSGRPILSSRKIAFPLSWERVRQIKTQNEPIEVQIHEWNSGGLLTKIEGLRAFLPLNHLLSRAMGTGGLRARVGERIRVVITEVEEQTGKLIVSEKRAWGLKYLRPGTLHDGVVNKIFPFGVEVNLAGTSLRGMIHISNVSRSRIKDLEQVFYEAEPVKVMVVKSPIPHRISLSTADLESSKGLILQDKEKVFREAEEMAARFRSSLAEVDQEEEDQVSERGMIENEVANWAWLDFGEETEFVELGEANSEH